MNRVSDTWKGGKVHEMMNRKDFLKQRKSRNGSLVSITFAYVLQLMLVNT